MTVFVAGIHGVGKSYLAEPVAARLGLKYARASQLIRDERKYLSWGESKIVNETVENQAALVRAVQRVKASSASLILDGHFVLRKAVNEYERIPENVFRDLACSAVILLTCPITTTLSRLRARGDDSWTEVELGAFSQAESEHASSVCESLMIPLVELHSPTSEEFESALRPLCASGWSGFRTRRVAD